jgi:hypothetical protein
MHNTSRNDGCFRKEPVIDPLRLIPNSYRVHIRYPCITFVPRVVLCVPLAAVPRSRPEHRMGIGAAHLSDSCAGGGR